VRRRHAALPHRQGRADHGPGVPTRECRMQRCSVCLAVSAHCTGISSYAGLPHEYELCQCSGCGVLLNNLFTRPMQQRCMPNGLVGTVWTEVQMNSHVSVHRPGGPVLPEDGN
jgi:hypothetical protein